MAISTTDGQYMPILAMATDDKGNSLKYTWISPLGIQCGSGKGAITEGFFQGNHLQTDICIAMFDYWRVVFMFFFCPHNIQDMSLGSNCAQIAAWSVLCG